MRLVCVEIGCVEKRKVVGDLKKEVRECWDRLGGRMGILGLLVWFRVVSFVVMGVFRLFGFMRVVDLKGKILEMGVVEMGWG